MEARLGVSVRTVQLALKGAAPGEKISRGRKKDSLADDAATARVVIILSATEAQKLKEEGKKRNPKDPGHGIYEAAICPAEQLQAGDWYGLADATFPQAAAVFTALRDTDPDKFVNDLRLYFQELANRLTGDSNRLQVHVVDDSFAGMTHDAA